MLIGCASCATLNRVPAERLADGTVCGKCKAALADGKPVPVSDDTFNAAVERTAAEMKTRVRFAKLDTEAAPNTAGRFGVRLIPTMILFKGGKEAARISGAMDARGIQHWLSQALQV
jgi:thioredoxin 2